MQRKPKQKAAPVKKPFLRGKPFDNTCIKSVAAVFGGTLALMLGFLILGGMMMWDNTLLRVTTNGLLLLCGYMLFYYSGTNRGTTAVNQGEIMYQRRETGREVPEEELQRSYHPAKGFIIGLLGCIPVVICGVLLAFVAKRQMVTAGLLPSWVSAVNRPEVMGALTAYQQQVTMTMEDVLRMIIRMSVMPVVNMIGVDNPDALLMMERFSALLLAIPGVAYGVGYLQGVNVRTHVHTNIAEGKRKQAKKARKAQNARKKQQTQKKPSGPEQLN